MSPRQKSTVLCAAVLLIALRAPIAAGQLAAADSTDASGFKVAPLPIIFYTPETKTAVGAALNVFYRPEGSTAETRPSTLTPLFIYTFKGQVITSLGGNHYWDEERNNVDMGFSYINFPDSFYGIGNQVSGDDPEDYTAETIGFGANYLRLVRTHLRMGAGAVFGKSNILEREDDGRLEADDIPGANGGTVVDLGATLDYDTRDNITFPQAGGWSRLDFQWFDGAIGSDFDLRVTALETRRYMAWGAQRVFAARALITHVDGTAPFQLLPSLGGDSLLRGYFGGRFRDRDRMAVEAEIRHPIWRRLGGVLFAGVGQVAHNPGDYRIDEFHAAGGFGLRILFIRSENLNLRFDFGWGEDDSGSYISLGEAF